jgi:hypothetical protein
MIDAIKGAIVYSLFAGYAIAVCLFLVMVAASIKFFIDKYLETDEKK